MSAISIKSSLIPSCGVELSDRSNQISSADVIIIVEKKNVVDVNVLIKGFLPVFNLNINTVRLKKSDHDDSGWIHKADEFSDVLVK